MGTEHSIARIHNEIKELKEALNKLQEEFNEIRDLNKVLQPPSCEFEGIQELLGWNDHNISFRQNTED